MLHFKKYLFWNNYRPTGRCKNSWTSAVNIVFFWQQFGDFIDGGANGG